MGRGPELIARSQAERAQSIMAVGIVAFRWIALAWMFALAATVEGGFARPVPAWVALGVAGAWTAWMSATREPRTIALWVELALAVGLVLLSGVVAPAGTVVEQRPFFATAWPAAAVLSWGLARGRRGGLLAAAAVGAALVGSRALNGVAPSALEGPQIGALVNGAVTYLVIGFAIGYVSTLLRASSAEYQVLMEQMLAARDRTARLEERASLARRIHDSVLQALALVHKRGRELAARETIPPAEVARLAEMAGEQEKELRALIQREPEEPPTGMTSLRSALERVARGVGTPPVQVSATGPMWVASAIAEELTAAVRQALDNVTEHAGASRATVFADEVAGELTVTVRDDGRGFVYDEEAFRADGKLGVLQSMRGRVESLGGRMAVESGARGTEVEFRVPVPGGGA